VPVPKRCTNTHPILRVSFGLCDRRITLRDLSTIRTVTRPVIWPEQANALIDGFWACRRQYGHFKLLYPYKKSIWTYCRSLVHYGFERGGEPLLVGL
jgi:hypothetical protein